MKDTDFKKLNLGDVVQHASGGPCYVVTTNYGERMTAARTVDLTNPSEWILVAKAKLQSFDQFPK